MVGGLVACGSGPAPQPSPTTALGSFQLLAQGYLDKAEEQGYSEEQVAIVKRAVETGEVTFEDYKTSLSSALACVTDAGIYNEMYPVDESRGFPYIDYFIQGTETGNPTADACIREDFEAIEALYQMQPSSVDAENSRFEKALDEQIMPCLDKLGLAFDTDGLSADEKWTKVLELSQEEPLPSDGTLGPVRTCMMNAGF